MKKTIIQILLSFFTGVALWSCSSETDAYAKLVSEWQGREIVFPDVMTDMITGDTIELSDVDFTILTYVDSLGCSSCKMKLPLWNEFLSQIDSITEYDFNVIMVVHPSDLRDVLYLAKLNSYEYPIYIDSNDVLNRINDFPEEPMYQSFLLDKNHTVISIGNPAYLSGIYSLYLSLLSGKKVISNTNNIVDVDENIINLEKVQVGSSLHRDVLFSNIGNDTVFINKVVASCNCMELVFMEEYLKPNSDIKAILNYKADTIPESIEGTIHIFYKDFESPSVIQIKGLNIN